MYISLAPHVDLKQDVYVHDRRTKDSRGAELVLHPERD